MNTVPKPTRETTDAQKLILKPPAGRMDLEAQTAPERRNPLKETQTATEGIEAQR
jgi:hypothetical protein